MERIDRESSQRSMRTHDSNGRSPTPFDDTSIGELLRSAASDASLLVQQEISLAKAEIKESATHIRKMAMLFAFAAVLAVPGAIALTAFLIIALGLAIGSYWASALIIGVVLMAAAALLVRRGLAKVGDGKVGVQRTIRSLGEDARWGQEELRALKREMTA